MPVDQEFLEFVVKAIVGKPESVKTTREVDERGVLLTLDVDPSDMGYVIGRQGQTARAVRTLLKIVGAKHNARVNLKINEPEGGRPRYQRQEENNASAPTSAPAQNQAVDDVFDTSMVDGFTI